ncbi:hypothetical protein THOM_1815, partial [Trachipleistophora hominis]
VPNKKKRDDYLNISCSKSYNNIDNREKLEELKGKKYKDHHLRNFGALK